MELQSQQHGMYMNPLFTVSFDKKFQTIKWKQWVAGSKQSEIFLKWEQDLLLSLWRQVFNLLEQFPGFKLIYSAVNTSSERCSWGFVRLALELCAQEKSFQTVEQVYAAWQAKMASDQFSLGKSVQLLNKILQQKYLVKSNTVPAAQDIQPHLVCSVFTLWLVY